MIGRRRDPSSINYVTEITQSGLTIYDRIEVGDPKLWIPTPELEKLLDVGLGGFSLSGLPLRTRSKVVKQRICTILGYPVPESFRKTKPRFLGQDFDTYIQKSSNLQIWNEELSPTRRYALIRVSDGFRIEKVKVVLGAELAKFDTTGKLTQKYQARVSLGQDTGELVSHSDTENLRPLTSGSGDLSDFMPTDYPSASSLLPINEIFTRLMPLVGKTVPLVGPDQERNRGMGLHNLICEELGYSQYRDDGRFPDIRNQLVEIKLQTSPTIDLGLILPTSKEPLDVPQINGIQVRHCDVRYVVFYANVSGDTLKLTNLFLVTGEDFFKRFQQFQGKVLNKKLQIPLPDAFFK